MKLRRAECNFKLFFEKRNQYLTISRTYFILSGFPTTIVCDEQLKRIHDCIIILFVMCLSKFG